LVDYCEQGNDVSVLCRVQKFLTSSVMIIFSRRTLLHGVSYCFDVWETAFLLWKSVPRAQ